MERKKRPPDGTHIYLWDSEYEYVYGHLGAEDYIQSVRQATDNDLGSVEVVHLYGRWSLECWDGERTRCLAEHDSPGRGRFPITRNR